MPLILKHNILAMADIQTNSDSSIYRVLIKNLIDNKNVWLNGNAQKMIEEFPIIDSTYQFMNSMRKSFTYKQLTPSSFQSRPPRPPQKIFSLYKL